jgi:hypothetical protein
MEFGNSPLLGIYIPQQLEPGKGDGRRVKPACSKPWGVQTRFQRG